jgi:hypothetical protein
MDTYTSTSNINRIDRNVCANGRSVSHLSSNIKVEGYIHIRRVRRERGKERGRAREGQGEII